jgi:hypothetical protein
VLHILDMSFLCCTLYPNAAVGQLTIPVGKELLAMKLIANLLVIFGMVELTLVDYFIMGT